MLQKISIQINAVLLTFYSSKNSEKDHGFHKIWSSEDMKKRFLNTKSAN